MPNHKPLFEGLEPRLMLTTLLGGDVFEYQDANDSEHIIRIALDGDIIAEFIAADLDPQNNIILGDIPGLITASTTGRAGATILGGIGGADGVELIGAILGDAVPAGDDLSLQALASMDVRGNGATYAFNIATIHDDATDTDILTIQLLKLDPPAVIPGDVNTTVESLLQQSSLGSDIIIDLSAAIPGDVTAFAIDPASGLAYAASADTLYSINRVSGFVTSIGLIDAGAITGVNAIAFRNVGGGTRTTGFTSLASTVAESRRWCGLTPLLVLR